MTFGRIRMFPPLTSRWRICSFLNAKKCAVTAQFSVERKGAGKIEHTCHTVIDDRDQLVTTREFDEG